MGSEKLESLRVTSSYISKIKKEEARVTCDGNYISLDNSYHIELDRIDTKEKMLEWVLHLSGKDWVTRIMVHRMVEVACKFHKLSFRIGV